MPLLTELVSNEDGFAIDMALLTELCSQASTPLHRKQRRTPFLYQNSFFARVKGGSSYDHGRPDQEAAGERRTSSPEERCACYFKLSDFKFSLTAGEFEWIPSWDLSGNPKVPSGGLSAGKTFRVGVGGLAGVEFGGNDTSTGRSALEGNTGGVPASGQSGRRFSGFIVYRIKYT